MMPRGIGTISTPADFLAAFFEISLLGRPRPLPPRKWPCLLILDLVGHPKERRGLRSDESHFAERVLNELAEPEGSKIPIFPASADRSEGFFRNFN